METCQRAKSVERKTLGVDVVRKMSGGPELKLGRGRGMSYDGSVLKVAMISWEGIIRVPSGVRASRVAAKISCSSLKTRKPLLSENVS